MKQNVWITDKLVLLPQTKQNVRRSHCGPFKAAFVHMQRSCKTWLAVRDNWEQYGSGAWPGGVVTENREQKSGDFLLPLFDIDSVWLFDCRDPTAAAAGPANNNLQQILIFKEKATNYVQNFDKTTDH